MKLDYTKYIKENEIPTPKWAIAKASKDALAAAEDIGFPVILKTAFGTHGTGVFYAENSETLLPIVEYLGVRDGNPIIIEEFVKTADRKDLRVYCVGGEIVAAMERTARPGDIRANSYIGGTARTIELREDEHAVVKKLLSVSELDIVGIDLLRSERGSLVIEINANPGFKKLEEVTGVDVANEIIRAAESKVV